MRTEVTAEEIAFYQENGFVVLEDVLDADELDRWRTAVVAAVEHRSEAIPGQRPKNSGEIKEHKEHLENLEKLLQTDELPEFMKKLLAASKDRSTEEIKDRSTEEIAESGEYYKRIFEQKVNLWQTDDMVRELVLDERIGRIAADLAGVDGIRLWHDQALFKPPQGNPTGWHLDVPYWSFTSPDALSMWIALDDATPENGCLYFVPGSHKARKYDNVGLSQLGALFEVYPEWRDIETVAAPMRAGSASFHNGLTAHGAGANMTSRPRRAMTLQFMPEGATYNGVPHGVLPPDYRAELTVGDVLGNDSVNPLLWSRTSQRAAV